MAGSITEMDTDRQNYDYLQEKKRSYCADKGNK